MEISNLCFPMVIFVGILLVKSNLYIVNGFTISELDNEKENFLLQNKSGKCANCNISFVISTEVDDENHNKIQSNEDDDTLQFVPDLDDINCENYGFCTEVSEKYPKKHIRAVLAKHHNKYNKFFTKAEIKEIKQRTSASSFAAPSKPTDITPISNVRSSNEAVYRSVSIMTDNIDRRRIMNDRGFENSAPQSGEMLHVHEEPLCRSIKRTQFLKSARNKDKNWRYIVNQDNYTQAVDLEECSGTDKPCSMADIFPLGYLAICKQEYTSRLLLAVDESGEIVPDLFPLPSCCKCIIRTNMKLY